MAKNEPVSEIIIKDELCSRIGITAKWLNAENISFFAHHKNLKICKGFETDFNNQFPINIHVLKKDFIFSDPILRSLIGEANSIFLSLQNVHKEGSASDYLKISRSYRSIIRACLEKLQERLRETSEEKSVYQNYITIFYFVECIWHLCEILYIDPIPSNVIVPQLLEWTRFHFPIYERLAAEFLQFENDVLHPDYWKVVKGLILQGNVQISRALLRLHPKFDTISFQTADQILQLMPIYNAYSGLSLSKFKSQWQYWVNDTESKIIAGALSSETNLDYIVKLITGNASAWSQQAKESTCWYEFFPCYIFYTEPGCKHFELGTFANSWLMRWMRSKNIQNSTSMKYLDKVVLSVMENNMNQVLHDIQNIQDNGWFAVHLTDLLLHAGQLQIVAEHQNDVSLYLRESIINNFGTALMNFDTLWMSGIDYLEHGSEEGLSILEKMLPRIAIKNEKYALKILSIAQAKNLTNIENEICQIMYANSYNNKRYGNALEWALRAQDYTLVTSLADMILKNYCKTGHIICQDILRNIGPKMLISPRLVFLVKYHDFHQFSIKKNFAQAAELLVNMLDSQLTPEYFWASVLADTLPLLESEEQIISSKGTYVIIHYLEQKLIPLIEKEKKMFKKFTANDATNLTNKFQSTLYLNPKDSSYFFNNTGIENIEELVRMMRLACARNLARSLIVENTNFGSMDT